MCLLLELTLLECELIFWNPRFEVVSEDVELVRKLVEFIVEVRMLLSTHASLNYQLGIITQDLIAICGLPNCDPLVCLLLLSESLLCIITTLS